MMEWWNQSHDRKGRFSFIFLFHDISCKLYVAAAEIVDSAGSEHANRQPGKNSM